MSKVLKMGRRKHCTLSEKEIILKFYEQGKSMGDISKLMNCSKTKIFNAIHQTVKPETRGRKRKTTARFDQLLVRKCKKDPFRSSKDLKNDLCASVTSRTIRNRLQEAELKSRSPRKVPLLSKKNIKKRLIFARQHLHRENWRNVLWSDETKINLFGSDGRMFVRRPKNKEFDPKYTKKTVKHGGGSLMLWGCFSASGVGPIYWINGKMCAVDYVEILKNQMLPYSEEEMPLKWEFMQDNDPKHSSNLVKSWFQENKVAVMDWPSQSPDLNPIEHLWGVLKKKIGQYKSKNKNDLWDKIQEAWYSISPEVCANLVGSMHRRCEEVIKMNGASTKY